MLNLENIHLMSPSQVREMYKNHYAQIYKLAEGYYHLYGSHIKGDENEVIKLIARMIIISDTFNVDITYDLNRLKDVSNIKNLRKRVSKLKSHAHSYKETLENTIREGIKIRHKSKPYFPPIFKNTSRVYFKISDGGFLTTIAQSLNNSLPAESCLELLEEKTDDRYTFFVKEKGSDTSSKQRLGRFLKQKSDKMTLLLSAFRGSDEDVKFKFIEKITKTNAYIDFAGGRIQKENGEFEIKKSWFKDFKNEAHFPAELSLDELLFKQIKHAMQKDSITTHVHTQFEKLLATLQQHYLFLDSEVQKIQEARIAQDSLEFDTILFSVKPQDISRMSAYNSWGSCMSPNGCNHDYVKEDIGRGTIIAYAIDGKKTSKTFGAYFN